MNKGFVNGNGNSQRKFFAVFVFGVIVGFGIAFFLLPLFGV